jgi:protocatechuate 3,4-dioxygenase beta subunit
MSDEASQTRRQFLRAATVLPAAFVVGEAVDVQAQAPGAPPTPACGEGDAHTPAQTAGPYFKPNSPRRTSLVEPGTSGTRIVIEGTVRTTDCTPVPRALVDFWQADDRGHYDNAGDRLRGHQFTDGEGRYRLETIVPGHYPGRTRHIHVKVQAPSRPVLTTQLYFPGDPANERDGLFRPELVLNVREGRTGRAASFDFVLPVSSARRA